MVEAGGGNKGGTVKAGPQKRGSKAKAAEPGQWSGKSGTGATVQWRRIRKAAVEAGMVESGQGRKDGSAKTGQQSQGGGAGAAE